MHSMLKRIGYGSREKKTFGCGIASSRGAFAAALKLPRTALDECQLAERLFPALKERVRKDKRPGQFYLSGSVRFTSKRLIRESLTGRIMTADLFPLTLSELDRGELPDWLPRLVRARRMNDLQVSALPAKEQATHALDRTIRRERGAAGRLFHP
jgi:hypothetical protein